MAGEAYEDAIRDMDHSRDFSHGRNRLWVRFVVNTIGTHAVDSARSTNSARAGGGPYWRLHTDVRGWQWLRGGSGGAQNQNLPGKNRNDRSYGSADTFAVALSGAAFHSSSPVLINVTGNSVHVDLSDNVIVEEPSPLTYVAISGGDGVASAEPTQLSTISASFTGYFKYCAGTRNQCSIDAMVRSMCRSENSRWTLTRL